MRLAGINPILAGKYDASTPAGAMAQLENPGISASTAMTAMAQTQKAHEEQNQIQAQVEKLTEETIKTAHEGDIAGAESDFRRFFLELDVAQAEVALAIAEEQIKLIERKGGRAETRAGEILGWISEIRESIFGGSAPFRGVTTIRR